MLHITNGDASAGLLRQALTFLTLRGRDYEDAAGPVIPWRDALHEGPVPSGKNLFELSTIRATFIYGAGWAPYEETETFFQERNATLLDWKKFGTVLLWFEHDLYDQLQLLQILHAFGPQAPESGRVFLINIHDFPGVPDFKGLGQLRADQLSALYDLRKEVVEKQFTAARHGWEAFTSEDPTGLELFLEKEEALHLPYLVEALTRHLEEFPSLKSGTSRTERQILETLQENPVDPPSESELFRLAQEKEEAPYMTGLIFQSRLDGLCSSTNPLVERESGGYLLTHQGKEVLAGEKDWVQLRGNINFWLGGVHLNGRGAMWRWDEAKRKLVKT